MHPARHGRGEIEDGVLLQRQRVHVAAKKHGPAGFPGVEDGDRARAARPFTPLERQIGELGTYFGEGLGSLEAKLRLRMDRAPKRGDAVSNSARVLKQVFGQHEATISRRFDVRQLGHRSSTGSIFGTPNAHQRAPTAATPAVSKNALS